VAAEIPLKTLIFLVFALHAWPLVRSTWHAASQPGERKALLSTPMFLSKTAG
jgi:hypothetical protein